MKASEISNSATRPPPAFVGDHLALDFLNSTATPSDEPIEWLGSGADLIDWLERAGAIAPDVAARFRAEVEMSSTLDAVAEQARKLREWWRGFVTRYQGDTLDAAAKRHIQPLNKVLAEDDTYRLVEASVAERADQNEGRRHALRWRQERRWTTPERLLQPIAQAIGDLICEADFRLIRTCEGPSCTLAFYDRTKTHGRRWCSMAVCGNRAKAAAHRAKRRRGKADVG